MDITSTLTPNSDQMNSEDLLTGPRTFTIARVEMVNNPDQPLHVYLDEFPNNRPWKPAKTVRRILAAGWGEESDNWIGKRVTLFRDATVTFGKDQPGGIRVSAMSGIKKPIAVWLTAKRGQRAKHTIAVLEDAAPAQVQATDYLPLVKAATTADECRGIWKQAAEAGALDDNLKAAIGARVDELKAAEEPEPQDDFFKVEEQS